MAIRRLWVIALGLFFSLGLLPITAALGQTTIQNGQTVAPNAPQLVLLHAPGLIQPPYSVPVYVSVKAGNADLKEIVWSFDNPPYSDVAFGSYRIKPGEEREASGHFRLSTHEALQSGTLSNAQDVYIYIKIWARDVNDQISKVGTFVVTLDLQAPRAFPPPQSSLSFAKNFGVIQGRIVPPVSDGSEFGGS
jgi:hypothetical protein